MKKGQSGFTLIEIAIVLVIIGLLLGGVLKGQELINSAKVKNLGNDLRSVQTAVFAFQDKYKALPGDYAAAATTFATPTAATAGDGNGTIAVGGTPDESVQAWDHLRRANLLTGTGATPPSNTAGGTMAIASTSATDLVTGMSGSIRVCSGGIPGSLARQLDIAMDDGNATTGNLRAIIGTTAGAGTAYDDASAFTVCMSF